MIDQSYLSHKYFHWFLTSLKYIMSHSCNSFLYYLNSLFCMQVRGTIEKELEKTINFYSKSTGEQCTSNIGKPSLLSRWMDLQMRWQPMREERHCISHWTIWWLWHICRSLPPYWDIVIYGWAIRCQWRTQEFGEAWARHKVTNMFLRKKYKHHMEKICFQNSFKA
jgi:hypothetical protein